MQFDPGNYFIIFGLAAIMLLTLALPFSVRKIEEELEIFLLAMGLCAATISRVWSWSLIIEALKEPVKISMAVLVIGFIFRAVRPHIKKWLTAIRTALGLRWAIFTIVLLLGFGSSVMTAIIAALALAEIISALQLDREHEIKVVVYACFAIGLGAALTPIGEPLSTIAVVKLSHPPHNADFFFLARLLLPWVTPGILASAVMAAKAVPKHIQPGQHGLKEDHSETSGDIITRGAKVYVFVAALILLGAGLTPLAERFIPIMPDWALYWANSISAILDNATLVAAELVPTMTVRQILFVLIGLLISGGMLIPGNIPNIISSAKLNIKSGEWARAAVPYGAALMLIYFATMTILVK